MELIQFRLENRKKQSTRQSSRQNKETITGILKLSDDLHFMRTARGRTAMISLSLYVTACIECSAQLFRNRAGGVFTGGGSTRSLG